jgi:hypothetical protein
MAQIVAPIVGVVCVVDVHDITVLAKIRPISSARCSLAHALIDVVMVV